MMIDHLQIVNAQDSLVYILYTLGVSFTEMANLKISDCDFKSSSILLTEEDGKTRTILVTNDIMKCVQDAINENKYWKPVFLNYLKLADSNYVFKRAKSSNSVDPRVDNIMLQTRLWNANGSLLKE